jgi:hypothetical protein
VDQDETQQDLLSITAMSMASSSPVSIVMKRKRSLQNESGNDPRNHPIDFGNN